jgi:xanthine dehydrogenase accessory factor
MKLSAETIHRRIAELLQQRKRIVVATISEVKGSAPQKAGAKMIVFADGSFDFTIGGGPFEAEVIQDALSGFHQTTPFHREYKLTKNEIGMYCQGYVRVLFETYLPQPRLMIFGGGHVGQALSKLAAASELFSVTVIDDREQFANREKHPSADHIIHSDRNFEKDVPAIDEETYVVIVTRCHPTDKMLVQRYAPKKIAAYIGVIGSEAKIRQFYKELEEEGVPASDLEELHAPIGLPIGGKSPAEVAISILAELVQVKNARALHQREPKGLSITK